MDEPKQSELSDTARASDENLGERAAGIPHELLFFEYDAELYAVSAGQAEAVIAWRTAARVPGADSRVTGVIQDRGRVVVLLAHPTGNARKGASAAPRRIIVCATPRGLVGLPAFETKAIETLTLATEPAAGGVYQSRLGNFSYLDPRNYGGGGGSNRKREAIPT